MSQATSIATPPSLQVFTKQTLEKGAPAKLSCVEIGGQTYSIIKGPVTVVGLEDDWYEDVRDPESVIKTLKASRGFKPDIFTFWQRLPDVDPKYPFYVELEEIAVLPIKSYDHWWNHQIKSRVRNLIRKSEKEGIQVREAVYDDDFVRGMTAIFNEAPVRQGRKFWHYGKDFQTVKRQFSRFIHREEMIGAYYQDELIGFVMLGNAGNYGLTGQIISSLKHRDKATNNALIAKTVEVCEKRHLPFLVYLYWSDDSLAEFKRRSGFDKVSVPRYFVPLTAKGKLALKMRLHKGWKAAIPEKIRVPLKKLRRSWYESRNE